jgi:uncharacterized protein YdeI (YjbR/CyaY-like superfamily)
MAISNRSASETPSDTVTTDDPTIECSALADWERWLEHNHADATGVWLKIAKKGGPGPTIDYQDLLDTAICFGWIDARRNGLDASFYLQRFTPRGPRSKWSQVNRVKATRLIDEGRMRAAGLAQVNAAQADGRWDAAYEPQSRATIPEDFQRALDQNPAARDFFATLTGTRRYSFLYRLHHVRTPAKRAERIANYIALLNDHRTLN